ncbi:MAG: SRPBCC domain-containing protein [Anditalea sp.]
MRTDNRSKTCTTLILAVGGIKHIENQENNFKEMENIEQINYIKAPVPTVYKALTSEDGLAQVWTKKLTVKPRIGFVNEFDFDEGYITKMKIVELQENNRVVWECIASDPEWVGTGIGFELSEKEGTTTVILRHFNWREIRWCNYN